jgi:hypothetical protein
VNLTKFSIGDYAFANNENLIEFIWNDESFNVNTIKKIGSGILSGCIRMSSSTSIQLRVAHFDLGGNQVAISARNLGSVSNSILYQYIPGGTSPKIIGGLCTGIITDTT